MIRKVAESGIGRIGNLKKLPKGNRKDNAKTVSIDSVRKLPKGNRKKATCRRELLEV